MKQNQFLAHLAGKSEYPIPSILLATALILLSPFLTTFLCYAAFVICLYRIVRYDSRVFATDYCVLIPITQIFRAPDGMSMLIWLCLIASIWYFVRGNIRANFALIILLLLLNYLISRMQMNIRAFVLCFGQIFILYVLLTKQNVASAVRAAKLFCWSLTISSLLALPLRGSAQLVAICGKETPAIWGMSVMRFQSFFEDPNYYSTLLIVALALLCKLKETNNIRGVYFWILGAVLLVMGILTYSKMFFLVFVLLGGIYIIWQFWNRKVFRGVFFSSVAVIAALFLLLSEASPIAVILERFTSAKDLSDLTTGRTDIYAEYWRMITKTWGTFLFGFGMASQVSGQGAHNIYIEIAYYFGVTGLILILMFYASMIRCVSKTVQLENRQNALAKYIVVFMVAVSYLALHGVFELLAYSCVFLGILSIMIVPKEMPRNTA